MNLDQLYLIALKIIDEPWGVGIKELKNNAEAQPPYYRFLHALVKDMQPRLVVECGTYLGVGALHMAVACKDTRVITIDKNPHPKSYLHAILHNNITMLIGDTTDIACYNDVKSFNECISILFLDSEHDGFTPQKEIARYKDLFCDETLIVCDDILDPRMYVFWDNLPGEKVEMNFLHPAQYPNMPKPGFGVSIWHR